MQIHTSPRQIRASAVTVFRQSLGALQIFEAFEKKLESLRKRRHLPSFSAGIVNEKKLVWKESFGYADVENKIKPTENTVYHLASITKTFGAIILMQQVEAGHVSLDDPDLEIWYQPRCTMGKRRKNQDKTSRDPHCAGKFIEHFQAGLQLSIQW